MTAHIDKSLIELLELPRLPHRVYAYPPLVLVVCQVRFNQELNVLLPEFVAPFQRALKSDFPLLAGDDEYSVEMRVEVEDQSGAPVIKAERKKQYNFRDRDNNWTAVLTKEYVGLETRHYRNFPEFLVRLQKVLDALITHIQPTGITRIGLRYINEFRAPNDKQEWRSTISPRLLGVLAEPSIAKYMALAAHEIQLRLPDNQGLSIRHGYFPSGSTVRPKEGAEIKEGPFYLLDFDLFKEFNPSDASTTSTDHICDHVREYNETVYQLFHWLAAEEYIAALEVVEDDD